MGTGGPEQLHPLTRLHTTNLLPAVSLPLYLTLTSKFQAPGANFQFLFRRLLLLHLFFLLIIIIIPPLLLPVTACIGLHLVPPLRPRLFGIPAKLFASPRSSPLHPTPLCQGFEKHVLGSLGTHSGTIPHSFTGAFLTIRHNE